MCQNHLEFGLNELQGSLSPKEIILLRSSTQWVRPKPTVKVKHRFSIQARRKYNVPLQSILPIIQKSKKTSTSQFPNKLLNEFIKTWFVLSVLKQFPLHLGKFLNSSVLLTKSIPFWCFILPFFAMFWTTLLCIYS